jgi:hypothetical protein
VTFASAAGGADGAGGGWPALDYSGKTASAQRPHA